MITEQTPADERLCAALVRHLESGFEQVVLAYQHRLYGFALRLSGNAQDAEEIAQDAFVRAYRALTTYTTEQTALLHLRPWLYQIALNVFRNRVRGLRIAETPLDGKDDEGDSVALHLEADAREQPERALAAAESERALAGLIAALPEHFRIAVVLRHIEGLSYGEMAALLGLPTGTLKAHVHRGVKLLRASLESLESQESRASRELHDAASVSEVG
jgi:RNA polymerase sigma-70 factor (ECF subfamily)